MGLAGISCQPLFCHMPGSLAMLGMTAEERKAKRLEKSYPVIQVFESAMVRSRKSILITDARGAQSNI